MKVNTCGLSGVASSTIQHCFDVTCFLYCLVLAVFAQCRLAWRYVRCSRWMFRLDSVTICLAFAFVICDAVGAKAQSDPTSRYNEMRTLAARLTPTTSTFYTASFRTRYLYKYDHYPGHDDRYISENRATYGLRHTYTENSPILAPFWIQVNNLQGLDYEFLSVEHVGGGPDCVPTLTGLRRTSWEAASGYEVTIHPKGPFDVRIILRGPFTELWRWLPDGSTLAGPFYPIESTIRYTGTGPFAIPVADAGDDQTFGSGTTVTINGTGSTEDCTQTKNLSYTWTRTGGTGERDVVWSTVNTAQSSQLKFTAETLAPGAADVTHVFELVVTDDEGTASVADTVTVTVTAPITRMVSNAGPDQTVDSGSTVKLDGSGSTSDRRFPIKSYRWTRTHGTGEPVTLTGGNTAQATFTADTLPRGADDVTHVFRLIVTDGVRETSADSVTVTVIDPFVPSDADAGPDQTVRSGSAVTLDANGSTVDRRRTITSYAWERTSGTEGGSVTLSDASAVQPSFTADTLAPGAADVTHEFTLRVTVDHGLTVVTDTVTVTVIADPIADAGPDQTVVSGKTVPLDGSGSRASPGRTIKSYAWERTSGTEGGSVTLSDASVAQPSFTADTLAPGAEDVAHEFTLTVTDSGGGTRTDTVTVTVTSPFAVPVAEAGLDQTVGSGAMVELDGSGSTVDRRRKIRSHAWKRTGGVGGSVTLNDASAVQPSFTAETLSPGAADVTYVFELTVTDSTGATDTDTVMVTVIAPIATPGCGCG